jgi:hypothetical protein
MTARNTLKRSAFLTFIFAAIFCTFSFAHAQYAAQGTVTQSSNCTAATDPNQTLQNPLCAGSLVDLLQEVLAYVTYIGSIFLVLVLVYVGFQFVMARGNPEAIGKAQRALLWTVIGGLILLGANAIAIVIVSTAASL